MQWKTGKKTYFPKNLSQPYLFYSDLQDANAQVSTEQTSMPENAVEDELPPIEQERGIIETETKSPAPMNVDDSDAEAIDMKETDISRPPLPNSPITVITSDNAGSLSITSTDAETACKVRECDNGATAQASNPTEHQQHVMLKPKQMSVGLRLNSLEDIESPLSPRDEPNLPLPVGTEEAASSFLVTSECPVLNVDEVQSILAMPPTPTVTCTASSGFSSPVVTSAAHNKGAPNGISQENHANFHQPTPLYQTPPMQQQYVPLNVQTIGSPYQQTPKVLMKYDGKQAYLLCSPQPVLTNPQLQTVKQTEPNLSVVSQPLNKPRAQVTYQYIQPQLMYTPPVIQPRPVYVAAHTRPMMKTVDKLAIATPQSQRFRFPVSSNVGRSLQGNANSVGKCRKISQVSKLPFGSRNNARVAAVPVSLPSTQGSLPVESSTATAVSTDH